MASPSSLQRLAAAQVELQAAQRCVKRERRRGAKATSESLQRVMEAARAVQEAQAACDAEDITHMGQEAFDRKRERDTAKTYVGSIYESKK